MSLFLESPTGNSPTSNQCITINYPATHLESGVRFRLNGSQVRILIPFLESLPER